MLGKTRDKASEAFMEAGTKVAEQAGIDPDTAEAKAVSVHEKYGMNDRGQTDASGAVNLVVALVVGALMAAFLLPIAIDELATVDTTGWPSGAAAMWDILPIMVVLAVFLFFVGVALKRTGRI